MTTYPTEDLEQTLLLAGLHAEYLSRAEAAARCRVPVSTFDKLRRDGLVPEPDAHMGKHLLWRADTIDELLARGGTAP